MDRMLSQESQPDVLDPCMDRPNIPPALREPEPGTSTGSSLPAGGSGGSAPGIGSEKALSGSRLSTGGSPDDKPSPDASASGRSPDDKPSPDTSASGRSQHSGRPGRRQKSRTSRTDESQPPLSAGSWFVTLMCMNIPVIGWFYLIILAFSKSAGAKKGFARAYILYKFIFLLITLAILAVAVHYGLEFLDKVLAYMEML